MPPLRKKPDEVKCARLEYVGARLVCPYCGVFEDHKYVETVPTVRHIVGVRVPEDDEPKVMIQSASEADDEPNDDGHIECGGCSKTFMLPGGVGTEWV